MPTYMYKCRDCGHRFEQVQGFHDDPVQICPDCGGQVQRVIGNVGVTFKGSGFYRTDSRTPTKSTESTTAKKTESTKPAGDSAAPKKETPAPKPASGSSTAT